MLNGKPLDQFEVFNELVRRGRRSLLRELFGMFVGIFGLVMWFLAANRPVPVVVWGDTDQVPARAVYAGEANVREIDARRFFNRMLVELHGWNSANVIEALSRARLLMTSDWRTHFEKEINQQVAVSEAVTALSKPGTTTRLSTYINAKVRNDVDIDWDSLRCMNGGQGQWHCKASVVLEPQPLLGRPVDSSKVRRKYAIKASFQEVPVTAKTVDGLLVSFWDAREAG